MNMSERRNGETLHHTAKFKHCTVEDFTSKGVKISEEMESIIAKRLCPDIMSNETMYKVKNIYTKQSLRNSISIEIRLCDAHHNPKCKSKEYVDDFLSDIYFT